MEQLMHEIHDYWTYRARGYSEYNRQEKEDVRQDNWTRELLREIHEAFPGKMPEEICVLDAGCGPGFFTEILVDGGFHVIALDCTERMIHEAKENLGAKAEYVHWMVGDVEHTHLPDMSVDVIVSRNVTWNLRHPEETYQEWQRILDSDGLLLNYDANWYRYLFDEEKRAAYDEDRENSLDAGIDDCNVGDHFDIMEEIARRVPLSPVLRPAWDEQVLTGLGFGLVETDPEIWREVWSDEEKISMASTPMFRIRARKANIKDRVVHYWSKRSETFLPQRRNELHDPITERWLSKIHPALPTAEPGKCLKILDVGCGAGYFSILLAKEGHECTGIDLTPEMIRDARILAAEEGQTCTFQVGDAEKLDFASESFDVVISRNLTWTLPHPYEAYKEWLRVLKPGGVLLNFDANYGAQVTAQLKDLPHDHAHHAIGTNMLEEDDAIKSQLPISFQRRPAWDIDVLGGMGISKLAVDFKVGSQIYIEKDQFYNPAPVFMLRVEK